MSADNVFFERVKQVRALLGYSKQEFAYELGISSATVGYWEKGIRYPRLNSKIRFYSLCAVHGIKYDDVPDCQIIDYIPNKEDAAIKRRGKKLRYKSENETRVFGY